MDALIHIDAESKMIIGLIATLLGSSPPAESPACTCLCMIPRLKTLVHLRPGESVTTVIFARRVNDHTRIVLDATGTYDIKAAGYWHDAKIRTDANGYRLGKVPGIVWPIMVVGTVTRRKQHERYFALIGQVESEEKRFLMGTQLSNWTPPASGELVTFANDVRFRYGNNRGCLTLTVSRLR